MFVGRKRELGQLDRSYESGIFQMVVVYGRRRVGKTALLHEFASNKESVVYFTARQTLAMDNLEELSSAIAREGRGTPSFPVARVGSAAVESSVIAAPSYRTFSDAFTTLFAIANNRRLLVIIDEYPYLAESYPGISSLLQTLIDEYQETSKMMLVLCGSSMSFMEHQVLGEKSPLYGRRTSQLKLKPFDAFDAKGLLETEDATKVVEFYSIVGGIPQYLRQLDASETTAWNIANRVLESGAYLSSEPDNFLLQEVRNPATYNSLLAALARGCVRPQEMSDAIGVSSSLVSQYLSRLEELSVVRKIRPLPMGAKRQVRYEIADNLLRFHYSFAVKHETSLEAGLTELVTSRILPREFPTYVGHSFEEVCRQWLLRQMIQGNIGMLPRALGTWWGADRQGQQEEVDIVAVGSDDELILGECKWTASPVGSSVLAVLRRRAALINGGEAAPLFIFSRSGFKDELRSEAEKDARVCLVTLADMFGA